MFGENDGKYIFQPTFPNISGALDYGDNPGDSSGSIRALYYTLTVNHGSDSQFSCQNRVTMVRCFEEGKRVNVLNIKPRLLLGPGPSPVPFTVRRAMSEPVIGHMDPQFFAIVDEVQSMLRTVFGTDNRLTLPVSGTGSAGMETAIVNFVEPGDTVIVVVAGVFGGRIAEAVEKIGAHAVRMEVPWGQSASLDQLKSVLRAHSEVRLVAVVMAETSTGVLQPLTGWADEVHRVGALLMVDAVTSLGGMPVNVDTQEFDVVFSGTQKCLSAPPGLSPFTVSERALERLDQRDTPVPSWYFDIAAFRHYWGQNRVYHHTAPISMIYALDEALTLIVEEGIDDVFTRHRRVAESLWAGLSAMGLSLMVPESHRLPTVTTVRIPDGVDDKAVRDRLLHEWHIEIAGGLGPWAGKIWRIGVMGQGAQPQNMLQLLEALRSVLHAQGHDTPSGLQAFENKYEKRGRH